MDDFFISPHRRARVREEVGPVSVRTASGAAATLPAAAMGAATATLTGATWGVAAAALSDTSARGGVLRVRPSHVLDGGGMAGGL